MQRCVRDAKGAAARITDAHTRMTTRRWFDRLLTQGLLGGALRDEAVEDAARQKRRAIRELVEPWKFDALDTVGVLSLLTPETSGASSPRAVSGSSA